MSVNSSSSLSSSSASSPSLVRSGSSTLCDNLSAADTSISSVIKFTNCRLVVPPPPPPKACSTTSSAATSHPPSPPIDYSRLLVSDDLWISSGVIIDAQQRFWEASKAKKWAADVVIDCKGLIIAPGFIDIQVNGAIDIDFSSADDVVQTSQNGSVEENLSFHQENLLEVSRFFLFHGVTSYCPTIITSHEKSYRKTVGALSKFIQFQRENLQQRNGQSKDQQIIQSHLRKLSHNANHNHNHDNAVHTNSSTKSVKKAATYELPKNIVFGSQNVYSEALGIHCEGPFISVPGAHPESLMQHSLLSPDSSATAAGGSGSSPLSPLESLYSSLDEVSVVTLAPELPGALPVISALRARDITVSAGHSKASMAESEAAVASGVSLVTHLFNAMVPFHHRDPGLIGLIGSPPVFQPFYSLIVDGHHTHPASTKIAYNSHPRGAILITDAMSALGLSDGIYSLGEKTVEIRSGIAHLQGTETLAGSIARLDECVRNFQKFTGCSLVEAIYTVTAHPAQCLGIDKKKGILAKGREADLVLMDEQMNVKGVWKGGKLAWYEKGAIQITNYPTSG